MMINTAVFDLDGTLTVRETGNIPSSTIDALRQLKKQNIILILATGRPYYEIDPSLIEQIGADYVVSLNGRILYDQYGKMISHNPIDSEIVQSVIKYAKENGFDYGVHTLNKTIILSGNSIQKQIENIIRRPSNLSYFNKLDESTLVYNIMIKIEDNQDLETFKNVFPELVVESFGEKFYDVYSNDSNKRIGVDNIFKLTHSQWRKTIVFGDGANDVCMAKQAFISFAMSDSHEDLLSVKNIRITRQSNEEGIPVALRELGLIEFPDSRHGWIRFKHRFTTTNLGTVLPISLFLFIAFAYDLFIMDLPGSSLNYLVLGSISLMYSIYLYMGKK